MTEINRQTEAGEMLAHVVRRREALEGAGQFLTELTVEAIDAARREGWTLSAIGEVLNVSAQRVHAISTERRTDDQDTRDPVD